jgi:hypothetical protein
MWWSSPLDGLDASQRIVGRSHRAAFSFVPVYLSQVKRVIVSDVDTHSCLTLTRPFGALIHAIRVFPQLA